MALEIEHKYLVTNTRYRTMAEKCIEIKQGYLCKDPLRTVRVRLWDTRGFLTIKGLTNGDVREEYEYEIPFADAEKLLSLCEAGVLEKKRYIVRFKGYVWEVDEFHGNREGLILAEIELPSSDACYTLPPFVGQNVTGDPRYYNSNL